MGKTPHHSKTTLTDADRARLAWATLHTQQRLKLALSRRSAMLLTLSILFGRRRSGGAA